MELGLQINVGQRQEQKLSPQMIQSLKLLQVNRLELDMMIKQEIEVNPLLEIEEDIIDLKKEEIEAKEEKPEAEAQDEIDWDNYLNDFDSGYKAADTYEAPEEAYERSQTYGTTLEGQLLDQIQDRHMPGDVRLLVEYLIQCLDDDGFLLPGGDDAPEPEDPDFREIERLIRDKADVFESTPEVRDAFHVLWTLSPAGIGARTLKECLLLQARRRRFESDLCMLILEKAFGMFRKLQISGMARKFDTTSTKIQEAIKELAILDPRPGRQVSQDASPVVMPDLIVDVVEEGFLVRLNDSSMPRLQVSKSYNSILGKGARASKEEKKFVRDKLNTANWLVKSIDQRKSTMLKVMNAIVEAQEDFFRKGPAFLKPLILQDIADKIGMHISTVNRVTNGKYVQIEAGVFELKHFFSAAVRQEDGTDVSAMQAKEAIKGLVDEEPIAKPLSDQKIADALKVQGLNVARRTVAKYREQMDILPARLRKKL